MTWFRVSGGGSGVPADLKADMNSVLNKKFGTSTDYPPNDWPETVDLMGPLEEKTVSGSIASFSDGADDVPIKSLVANLPARLTPYENIEIMHTGKNMLNPATCQMGYIEAGGGIHGSQAYLELYSDYIKVKPNTTYTFSGTVNNSSEKWRGIAYYDKDKNFIIRQAGVSGTDEHFSIGYTTPNNSVYVRCTWRNYSNIESGGSVCPCQFEEGTETEYEPYNGEAYNIEIPNPNPDIFNYSENRYQRGAWKADGTVNPDEWSCWTYKIPIESGATYDIFGEGFFTLVTYFDANDNFISSETLTKTADFHEAVTIPANCAYLGVSYEGFYVMETKYIKKAFNVYGGSIEAISGEAESEIKKVKFSDLTWYTNLLNGAQQFYAILSDSKTPINNNTVLDGLLCRGYNVTYANDVYIDTSVGDKISVNTGNALQVRDYSVTTLEEFKAKTANYELVYPLTTPGTFQTEPIAVNSKAGYNNIWNDAGDTEITYRSNGAAEYYPAGEEVSF